MSAKLEASLAALDRTFAKMKAENAAARARRTPAEQSAWEASLKASGEYTDRVLDGHVPTDDYDGGLYDWQTSRGLNSGLRL